MKKFLTYALVFATALGFAACSDDENDDFDYAANLDYTAEYSQQWGNYMVTVSNLLKEDATNLYNYWLNVDNDEYPTSYANIFKSHNNEYYGSALECVEEILDGCTDIASEVGASKIGEPYNLYVAGKRTEALYAVESWYSWHSRDDYTNNIVSIRNSYLGTTEGTADKYNLFATPAHANSLSALVAAKNPELDARAKELIQAAATAIQNIVQPFRNNINSEEAKVAMDACAALEDFIQDDLKAFFSGSGYTDAELDPAITQYVDGVVLPTYKALMEKNIALDNAVRAFKAAPSNAAFAACANAWLEAREPWESSEAFLFGPVDAKGLDPNMDSWPLDQVGIVNILKSQAFDNLNWDESESEEAIEDAQALRGFHTLEYFIFKDGKARTIN
ncbi:MAG: peptidase M75 [Alloprevotella sp.]|nr:peptidase M75 [Alloprevotella sp.]